MELWIRSQEKMTLTPINELLRIEEGEYVDGLEEQYTKYNIYYKSINLGSYKKERALEVLDQIQRLLKPRIMMKYNDDCTMSVSSIEEQPASYVYEMPKE